jgi:hypothetical protein
VCSAASQQAQRQDQQGSLATPAWALNNSSNSSSSTRMTMQQPERGQEQQREQEQGRGLLHRRVQRRRSISWQRSWLRTAMERCSWGSSLGPWMGLCRSSCQQLWLQQGGQQQQQRRQQRANRQRQHRHRRHLPPLLPPLASQARSCLLCRRPWWRHLHLSSSWQSSTLHQQ